MTIATTDNRANYVGDDIITQFSFSFKTFDDSHIFPYLDAVVQGSGFTVTRNADQDASPGGVVDFTTAPASGVLVTLERDVPLTQQVDYPEYDPFPSATHEKALDTLTQQTQQLNDKVARSLQLPVSSSVTDLVLPEPIAEYLLQWNAAADALNNVQLSDLNTLITTTPFTESLLDDPDAATARATLAAAGLGDANIFTKSQYLKRGVDIASANDLVLLSDGNSNDITGTVTVNGMTDGVQNEQRHFHADGIFTLKHDTAPSSGFSKLHIVQGAADVITAAGDEWDAVYDGTVWRIVNYNRASGNPLFYEEGTWTPVIKEDGGVNEATMDGSTNGSYEKIGRQVTVRGYIRTTNTGGIPGGSGLLIIGLPYTSNAAASAEAAVCVSRSAQLAITAGYNIGGYIAPNSAEISLMIWDTATGTTQLTATEYSSDGILTFSATYMV